MSDAHTLYNNLPTVIESDERFINRDEILAKLGPIFAKYDGHFGLCLVHHHTNLNAGEIMVANGRISEPVLAEEVEHYPERWLITGEPYEFNKKPTESLPQSLLDEVKQITDGNICLGICYLQDEVLNSETLVEKTIGRANITEVKEENSSNVIATCWVLKHGKLESPYVCMSTGSGHVPCTY